MFPEVNGVEEFFFKNPTTVVHLRELARRTGFSPAGTRKIVKRLVKRGIVREKKGRAVVEYNADIDGVAWLPMKRVYNLASIYAAGLVGKLIEAYDDPKAIILFGSYARGDDVERSDVDIAILTSEEKRVDLAPHERALSRSISIHHVQLGKVSEEFRSNLCNGIVLHGAL